MPRSKDRAGVAQVNHIHRLVARSLERALKNSLKGAGETPAALLGKAIEFLRMTDVTAPERDPVERDTLRDAMPDFDLMEKG